ncbi:OPA3-domain-containing protein [Sparassis latifolia]
MASAAAKVATLAIRTLAKPISSQVKTQAKQHKTFRKICVSLAQNMYKAEINLRTNLLGEPAKHVRPLSETKAIENGANALAEGFLFSVASLLILGESWRSSRTSSKRRDIVDEQLEELRSSVSQLTDKMDTVAKDYEERFSEEKQRNDELTRILQRVVEIGLRGGWAEFEGTPLVLPRIELVPQTSRIQRSPGPSSNTVDSDIPSTPSSASSEEAGATPLSSESTPRPK